MTIEAVPIEKLSNDAIADVLDKLADGNREGALRGLLIVCLGRDGKLSYVRAGSATFFEVLGGLEFIKANVIEEMTEGSGG